MRTSRTSPLPRSWRRSRQEVGVAGRALLELLAQPTPGVAVGADSDDVRLRASLVARALRPPHERGTDLERAGLQRRAWAAVPGRLGSYKDP